MKSVGNSKGSNFPNQQWDTSNIATSSIQSQQPPILRIREDEVSVGDTVQFCSCSISEHYPIFQQVRDKRFTHAYYQQPHLEYVENIQVKITAINDPPGYWQGRRISNSAHVPLWIAIGEYDINNKKSIIQNPVNTEPTNTDNYIIKLLNYCINELGISRDCLSIIEALLKKEDVYFPILEELIRFWDAPKNQERDNLIKQSLLPATEELLNTLKKFANDPISFKKQAAVLSLNRLMSFPNYPGKKEKILAICEHLRGNAKAFNLASKELDNYPRYLADIH